MEYPRHLLLPPSDDEPRKIQIPLLTNINKKIEEMSDDEKTRDMLRYLVYWILTYLDGFYLDFDAPFAMIAIDNSDQETFMKKHGHETFISGDLHKLFYFMFMHRDKTSREISHG